MYGRDGEEGRTVVIYRFLKGCGGKGWYKLLTQWLPLLCERDRFTVDEGLVCKADGVRGEVELVASITTDRYWTVLVECECTNAVA